MFHFITCTHIREYPHQSLSSRRMKRNDDGDFFSSKKIFLKTHSLKCMMFSKTPKKPVYFYYEQSKSLNSQKILSPFVAAEDICYGAQRRNKETQIPLCPNKKCLFDHFKRKFSGTCLVGLLFYDDARNGRSLIRVNVTF
jgi:hypothetical protein